MDAKYNLKKDAFDYHCNCELSLLKQAIQQSRNHITNARKRPFSSLAQAKYYDSQYNLLDALLLVEKLRNGVITIHEFEAKVHVDIKNLHE
jgi:hypothetical protein